MKSLNKLSERNDNVKRIDRSEKVRVHFHQAKWDEPIIYELSTPGERGILVGAPDEEIAMSGRRGKRWCAPLKITA